MPYNPNGQPSPPNNNFDPTTMRALDSPVLEQLARALYNIPNSLKEIVTTPSNIDRYNWLAETAKKTVRGGLLGATVGGQRAQLPGALQGLAFGGGIGLASGLLAQSDLEFNKTIKDQLAKLENQSTQGMPNLGMISAGGKLLNAEQLALDYYGDRAKPIAKGLIRGLPNVEAEDLATEAIAPIMEVATDATAREFANADEAYKYLDNVARNSMRDWLSKFGYKTADTLTDEEGVVREIVDQTTTLPNSHGVSQAAEIAEQLTREQSLAALEKIIPYLRPRDQRYVQARAEGIGVRRTAANIGAKNITVQKSIPETLVKIRENLATGQPVPLETRWGTRETDAILLGAKGWRKELHAKYSTRELLEAADALPKEERAFTQQYLKGRSPQYLKDNFQRFTADKLFGNLKELARMLENRP